MVNLLIAILISAVVGFLAGHFSSQGSDPRPVSMKEAVTGDLDAPPVQFNLPRPPPAVKAKPTPPVMCEAGKTIQQQIETMNFADVKRICNEAERRYKTTAIDAYAPYPDDATSAGARAPRELLDQVRESAKESPYWRGDASVTQGDRVIQIDIFVRFSESGDPNVSDSARVGALDDPEKLCTGFSPFFTINGKGMSTGSMGGCGGGLRRRGDSFLFSWETFNDEALSPVMTALMVPVPGAPQSDIEYLSTVTGNWTAVPFRWRASTHQEFESHRDRHSKTIER